MAGAIALMLAASATPISAQRDSDSGIERPANQLSEQQVELAATLDQLRRSSIDLAADVIATQMQINAIEQRISAMRAEESAALDVLDGQRERLNRLAAGLQRLSRTPVEVWAIADGPSAELIRGALLLNHAMAPVEEEAEDISETIAVLSETRARLARERAERNAMTAVREEQMSELNRLVGERQNTLDQLVEDSGILTERLSNLALGAESTGALIMAIDDDDLLRALEARIARTRAAIIGGIADEPDASGANPGTILPAAGSVETEFGAEEPSGERAQRITLTVAPATLVVAPVAGVVRYAGPFADDGLILILDHGGGYHSTIAGVGRLDVMAGQAVRAGEPVAVTALPQSETTPTSTLFFEVRRNGSPVNPMTELVLAQGRGPE